DQGEHARGRPAHEGWYGILADRESAAGVRDPRLQTCEQQQQYRGAENRTRRLVGHEISFPEDCLLELTCVEQRRAAIFCRVQRRNRQQAKMVSNYPRRRALIPKTARL